MDIKQLKIKSLDYRKTLLEIIYNSNAGHTAGSLSCIDIVNVLYNDVLNITPKNFNSFNRNRYIQSKGHSVEALYTVLCDQGFFKRTDLAKDNLFMKERIYFKESINENTKIKIGGKLLKFYNELVELEELIKSQ